jgi:hypothetical protein
MQGSGCELRRIRPLGTSVNKGNKKNRRRSWHDLRLVQVSQTIGWHVLDESRPVQLRAARIE